MNSMPTKKIKSKIKMLPTITRGTPQELASGFPVGHYSYSSLVKFATNPLMFKINYINRDQIESTKNVSGVIGTAFHKAMEVYYRGVPELLPTDEAHAIELGLKQGMTFLEQYNDSFIEYSEAVENKQKAYDLFSFLFASYVKEKPFDPKEELISTEEMIIETIDVEWRGHRLTLPVPLKCYLDKLVRRDGKLKIIDYKTCRSFSDLEKIDGKKILQAVVEYLLVYARYGEAPYSMIYEENKITKNKDGGPQVREYEIIYEKNELYFDFFFRFYEDITNALNGHQVFVPNLDTFYDNEVSIIAYIHRLDIPEKQAELMKKLKVTNITDLLKKKIQSAGNMRTLLKTIEKKFVSAKNLNYERMQNHEKITTKMMEHGMMLGFDSKIEGATVDLYRFLPSIGLKMARIENYVADVEQVLGVAGIRVLAPIPGSTFVGFEVPRAERSFPTNPGPSADLRIGIDTMGSPLELRVEDMPHLLVAGATGSGKSVFLNALIKQCSKKYTIKIFDPKGVDFADGISNFQEINESLQDSVSEMKRRYKIMKNKGIKRWSETGDRSTLIVIDEYNDLYMCREKIDLDGEKISIGSNIDHNIKLLAQKARAAGIHIILATQRPSIKVIDGDIKANFPTRICFRLPTSTDSKVVLDMGGAEKLLGKGDGLLLKDGYISRFQSFKD